jgi:hypothetical protein
MKKNKPASAQFQKKSRHPCTAQTALLPFSHPTVMGAATMITT